MKLLVVGSVALDTIETPFDKVVDAPGGSALYISISASYFTKSIGLVGIIGDDFPSDVIDDLKGRGVNLKGLKIINGGKTFRWAGKYHYDMNTRETIYTHLNVFADFKPVIPDEFKSSEYVCLGNIDPTLQMSVLDQVDNPKLVIADTMNFWIERKYDELLETLKRVNVLIVNDAEARQIAREPNLIKAGKKILKLGPEVVIIKKGEHGAVLMIDSVIFSAPAYPIESIQDPTGAGDTFAGGFAGWIAKTDDISEKNLRKAVIYGSAIASFCVEGFGINRIRNLSWKEIQERFEAFREITKFEVD
ncbi:PfkB family carbohydrate kinase [Candidatus Kryptobacter tengchongensis]|uniref:PfkB family carbohydrate kinase n=1 Tax=Kryptobacter tengchongensis TaxID=1643429 RepID=UPI000707E2C0|nr:PfkB family carbohydrate kinase [Candidatus Kryptobacter tengchongensis]CUS81726.1 Sugar or nucleoside kinase, ribokinase family [Candidatus Kryptobacter tengchongensis]